MISEGCRDCQGLNYTALGKPPEPFEVAMKMLTVGPVDENLMRSCVILLREESNAAAFAPGRNWHDFVNSFANYSQGLDLLFV